MGDLIFKCSGPVRAIEVQIPMSKSVTELDAVKKLLAHNSNSDEDDTTDTRKKKKKSQKQKSDGAKIGASTLGVLLASVLLAAMKDD